MATRAKVRDVRFVVLSEARSGSTLLVSLLDSHPAVSCYREVFHRRKVYAKPPLDELSVEWRDAHVQEVLNTIFEEKNGEEGITARGFKLFYYHKPSVLYRLAKDPSVRFILLRRDDKLSQYASRKIALRTGRWEERVGTAGRPPSSAEDMSGDDGQIKVAYRLSGHLGYCIFSEFCYFLTRRVLHHFRSSTLVLRYEDLASDINGKMHEVMSFLEVPFAELSTSRRRQNTPNAMDRFKNPDRARKGLKVQRVVRGVFTALDRPFRTVGG